MHLSCVFFCLGPFVLSLSLNVSYPQFFRVVQRGECHCFQRRHLKGETKPSVICHGFKEPHYDFSGCISSLMIAFEILRQKLCVRVVEGCIDKTHCENVIGRVM